LKLLGYLVSRFKRARIFQRSYLKKLRDHFGRLAFDTVIPDLAGYEKSVTHGIPITLHAPSSHEAEVARTFFREVERRTRIYSRRSPQGGRQHVQREAVPAAR
jgi:cellulose biosynthesis protein BcsQ